MPGQSGRVRENKTTVGDARMLDNADRPGKGRSNPCENSCWMTYSEKSKTATLEGNTAVKVDGITIRDDCGTTQSESMTRRVGSAKEKQGNASPLVERELCGLKKKKKKKKKKVGEGKGGWCQKE